ncbi:MAG TPA: SufE family protein [Opitutaceae bacterium]|nr:SufE family protein [Opitutaceae bacterium]
MPLRRKLQQLLDELAAVDDPQERLALVLDRAKKIPPLPAAARTAAHRVPGCISPVWLHSEMHGDHCIFHGDAESPLVRGLVVLLCEFHRGATPAQILATDADPLDALGLARHLSPTRRNGLAAVRGAIRAFARQHLATHASAP